MSKNEADRNRELDVVYGRCLLMLDALAAREPDSTVLDEARGILERAHAKRSLRQLQAIAREVRSMLAVLPPSARQALDATLATGYGPDASHATDAQIATAVRARGRIRSEREYRAVSAYADAISQTSPDGRSEYAELGRLLDEFSATPVRREDVP